MSSVRQQKSPPRTSSTLGFDFTRAIRLLCNDVVDRLRDLAHIDMSRVAISFSQTRKTTSHGLYATLTPMRFAGGQMHTIRRGRKWAMQRVLDSSGREMLYILRFYLPRFLNLTFPQKLTTVVHELWHISPRFDGDLRRYVGRCYAHTGSQKRYDAQVEQLADRWLSSRPAESIHRFLHDNYRKLLSRYGRVYGTKIPVPKLIPLP